jgi:hypothetical protein
MNAAPMARNPINGMTPSRIMRARTENLEKIGMTEIGAAERGADLGSTGMGDRMVLPRGVIAVFHTSKTENG